ncbi:MAG: carbohydrate ABC transporter permease [Candidatus Sumerlaeia bacterium]|nr:carbohydrate ABC transporter permease [Candidatus Sumerlaeia bacterium]
MKSESRASRLLKQLKSGEGQPRMVVRNLHGRPNMTPLADPRIAALRWLKRVIVGCGLLLFTFLFLFPLAWMILTSLKPAGEVLMAPPTFIPSEFLFSNYEDALRAVTVGQYFGNTLYLALLNMFGTLLSSTLAAYGFACIRWRGRDTLFVLTITTMMIPFPVLMVPLYSMFQEIGWVGTFKPLWVPSFFGNAYAIFLLRQFFLTIPRDVLECARLDGCSEFRIFWQVVLPLSKPALASVALFSFLATWNDLLGPLVYLTDQNQYTLMLGLQDFATRQSGSSMNLLAALGLMMTLPVVILYIWGQNTFLKGMPHPVFRS